MIKLTEINKIYRTNEIETVALENVNLEVEKGEFLSIMGPSGWMPPRVGSLRLVVLVQMV